MKNSGAYAAACSIIISLCLGCSSTTQTRHLYTLHSHTNVPVAEPAVIEGGLGIGPVELPESFSGNGIVSLGADQQIHKSRSHLWAGDLKKAISRTLTANLSQQLALDDIWPFPWDTRHRPEKQVSLFIEQLSGQLGEPVTMVVKWTLFDARGSQMVDVGRHKFTAPSADDSYGAYVAAINDLINQLSIRLESEIRQQWLTGEGRI